MKLIDNWKQAWKWLSVHCMIGAATIQAAWMYIPDDLRQNMPHKLVAATTIILLILGVIGRVVKQG